MNNIKTYQQLFEQSIGEQYYIINVFPNTEARNETPVNDYFEYLLKKSGGEIIESNLIDGRFVIKVNNQDIIEKIKNLEFVESIEEWSYIYDLIIKYSDEIKDATSELEDVASGRDMTDSEMKQAWNAELDVVIEFIKSKKI